MADSYTAAWGSLASAVEAQLASGLESRIAGRIWAGDFTLWAKDPATPEIRDRLGWLRVADAMQAQVASLAAFAADARPHFDRTVLLGMGGSSLAPEVFWRTAGAAAGFPSLHVLDSTDPRAVARVTAGNLGRTLFLVASKSGSTLETDALFKYFWDRKPDGAHFVAITDPNTSLVQLATERHFRRVFENPADIGGRYSALSYFGLVPAALLGMDVATLLAGGVAMAHACREDAATNPGLRLGAALGAAAGRGRDKLTFLFAPEIESLGLWLEQLVAESTGKNGTGIVPIAGEALGAPVSYGDDRVFVVLDGPTTSAASAVHRAALQAAGHPVLHGRIASPLDLGAEFFRWEFATAVAGAVLGIHPFDQPNVAESKRNTLEILATRPAPTPAATRDDLAAFAGAVQPGDYVALLAYLPATPEHDARLAGLQARLRDRWRVAVSRGFGPRYLHSTGQLHKGGPARGHFLLITSPLEADVPIPGGVSFGTLESAQAEGDLRALRARGRPALRVEDLAHLDALA